VWLREFICVTAARGCHVQCCQVPDASKKNGLLRRMSLPVSKVAPTSTTAIQRLKEENKRLKHENAMLQTKQVRARLATGPSIVSLHISCLRFLRLGQVCLSVSLYVQPTQGSNHAALQLSTSASMHVSSKQPTARALAT
jgi:hypothetical protein